MANQERGSETSTAIGPLANAFPLKFQVAVGRCWKSQKSRESVSRRFSSTISSYVAGGSRTADMLSVKCRLAITCKSLSWLARKGVRSLLLLEANFQQAMGELFSGEMGLCSISYLPQYTPGCSKLREPCKIAFAVRDRAGRRAEFWSLGGNR